MWITKSKFGKQIFKYKNAAQTYRWDDFFFWKYKADTGRGEGQKNNKNLNNKP